MNVERQNKHGHWLPAEPLPEPFGVLWGRLWHERRRRGESRFVALLRSWRDARAITEIADMEDPLISDLRAAFREPVDLDEEDLSGGEA
jgi:hypothetical protein